jgi:hypothetical protein
VVGRKSMFELIYIVLITFTSCPSQEFF